MIAARMHQEVIERTDGSFFRALVGPPAGNRHLALGALRGKPFALFPVDFRHSLFHLATGVWALLAAMCYGAPVTYARTVAILYGMLAVMGLIPVLDTLFGLIPLHGHDIWLHAGSALIAAYFGLSSGMKSNVPDTRCISRSCP